MPRDRNYTPCTITTPTPCHEPANIVLFALGGEFGGRTYQPGQRVTVCIRHGGHILDARRHDTAWIHQHGAPWLRAYHQQLPLPKLPEHDAAAQGRPQPWAPPSRPRRTDTARDAAPRERRRAPYERA